jgi:hypothetical protein
LLFLSFFYQSNNFFAINDTQRAAWPTHKAQCRLAAANKSTGATDSKTVEFNLSLKQPLKGETEENIRAEGYAMIGIRNFDGGHGGDKKLYLFRDAATGKVFDSLSNADMII